MRHACGKATNTLYVSEIFDWFPSDFTKAKGTVQAYIGEYLGTPNDAKLEFLEWDWSLNEQVRPPTKS